MAPVLGDVEEGRARVIETWALCLHCLRRERWGWEAGEWKLLETTAVEVTDGA
jgi:hypothetical protein